MSGATKRRDLAPVLGTIAALLALAAPQAARAHSGQLDCTFGTLGQRRDTFGTGDISIGDFAVYRSGTNLGKVLVAGSVSSHMLVLRFNADGTPDTTFGGTGSVTVTINATSDFAVGVAVDSNNKVVLGGRYFDGSSGLAVARLNDNGSLDTTFNGTGKFSAAMASGCGGDCEFYSSVAVQSDNKILVSGRAANTSNVLFDSIVVRLTTAGALDATYGSGGKARFAVSASATDRYEAAQSMVLDASDNAYLLGSFKDVGGVYKGYAAKLGTTGALDGTFGTSGKTVLNAALLNPGSANVSAGRLALQTGGSLVGTLLSRYAGGSVNDTTVVRLTSLGALDTTFSTDGVASVHLGPSGVDDGTPAVAVQSDGSVLVTADTAGAGYQVIARLTSAGALDTAYGFDGTGIRRIQDGAASKLVGLDNGGNALLAGLYDASGVKKVVLSRFLPANQLMTYVSTVVGQVTAPVSQGRVGEVLDVSVCVNGDQSPFGATSFDFATTGSTAPSDLTGAAVYSTGRTSTFSSAFPFGSAVRGPSGTFTIAGAKTLGAEQNHFWLAYDVSASAVIGHVVDGQVTSATVNGIVRTPSPTSPAGSRTVIDTGRLFYLPFQGTPVRQVKVDGTGDASFVAIPGGGGSGIGLDLANERLSYVDSANFAYRRIFLDGTGDGPEGSAQFDYPQAIAVDPAGGKVYWGENSYILRSNLDGTVPEAIVSGITGPVYDLALDTTNGKVYWTAGTTATSTVGRANLDGSSPTLGLMTVNVPKGIAVNPAAGYLYVAESGANRITRATLAGASPTSLVTTTAPRGLDLDAASNRLYWGNAAGAIQRSALDGTGTASVLASGTATGWLKVKPLASTSADGSGTLTVAPTTGVAGATNQTYVFTYTAATGGLFGGEIDVDLPAGGWSCGSVSTTSGGSASFASGRIQVTGVTLASGTTTITCASATVGSTLGANSFPTSQRSTAAGMVTPLLGSPSVTVALTPVELTRFEVE